ncbi:MAG TPA: D-alanyl-D-alanine carboxypeptidase/D-alanyl-D-alanine-endopeptidase [Phycisphaerales bacterium]|nr:D-alanyl-D-alanine carboxypeptidase/D-alanyl-D-alanine-endopeptidase [Phycisphaerales bacterium]
MKARWLVSSVVIACLLIAGTVADASLRDDVERAVRNAPLKGGVVSVSIRDSETGNELVSINSSAPMIPASNMKLLTTGSALHALGANFTFKTRLLENSTRLIVQADGDPAFGDPALLAEMTTSDGNPMDVEGFLKIWTDAIRARSLKYTEIVVDDRVFDRQFVHPDWPTEQLNQRYCAEVCGLTFHVNLLDFYPKSRIGQSPDVSDFRPFAPWISVANSATSKAGAHESNTAWISRPMDSNDLRIHGNVEQSYKEPVQITVHDMATFFAKLLADRATMAGVTVDSARIAKSIEDPPSGTQVGPTISTPLTTVITRCNQESQNLYAECLLKRIGYARTGEPGSWLNGSAIIRHVLLERLDDPALLAGVNIADGSGLSRENRITARMMTAWLKSFHDDQVIGPAFINSLAVGGESGTLESRFSGAQLGDAKVQAKTGYINQVSCLSGYVTMPDGRQQVFSVLVNNLKEGGTVRMAKNLQEKIVQAIIDNMSESNVVLGGD